MSLDLAGRPRAGFILERIRTDSRDESEKGRWFEQLFMRIALQQPEFEIDEIWRWPDWPQREALTCAFYLFIRQPMGRKSALRREIPWILRGFQGRLSC